MNQFWIVIPAYNEAENLDVLLPRLQQCQAERGLLPNLVSIDFWEQGDALQAVDILNGLG